MKAHDVPQGIVGYASCTVTPYHAFDAYPGHRLSVNRSRVKKRDIRDNGPERQKADNIEFLHLIVLSSIEREVPARNPPESTHKCAKCSAAAVAFLRNLG
jgi:hypothetical protein